jgi:hypothetical protein
VLELGVGDPERAVPGEQQRGVAVAVGLEGAAAAVVRPLSTSTTSR